MAYVTEEQRWDAVQRRDTDADGVFFYGVASTGVFCKPSCPSRRAKRQNVSFFTTVEIAAEAGFRPCRRCRPTEPPLVVERLAMVAEARGLVDESHGLIDLETLSTSVFMSKAHFHRIFKAVVGATPKQYALQQRRAKQSVLRFGVGQSSLGAVLVAASGEGVVAILIDDDPEALVEDLRRRFPAAELVAGDGEFEQWMAMVVSVVDDSTATHELPLDIRGTVFQQRVWHALRQIPIGSTASYAEVAVAIGMPTGARAIASACAANHLAVAIPCHRVVKTDGELSGYRWGVERKAELLRREAGGVG